MRFVRGVRASQIFQRLACCLLLTAPLLAQPSAFSIGAGNGQKTGVYSGLQPNPTVSAESCLRELSEREGLLESGGWFTGMGLLAAMGVGVIAIGTGLAAGRLDSDPRVSIYGGTTIIGNGLSFLDFSVFGFIQGLKPAKAAYYGKVVPIASNTPDGAARREHAACQVLRSLADRDRTARRVAGVSGLILGAVTSVSCYAWIRADAQRGAGAAGVWVPVPLGCLFGSLAILDSRTKYERAYEQYVRNGGIR
jgi:hypothetical protein